MAGDVNVDFRYIYKDISVTAERNLKLRREVKAARSRFQGGRWTGNSGAALRHAAVPPG
jgi:hypothetical protein